VKLGEFQFDLPRELIAQEPSLSRAASRMLVLYRAEKRWEDRTFRELPGFLRPGDCLILNDSRVIPSRLLGRLPGHAGEIEVFLLRPVSADRREWSALVRPGKRLRAGVVVRFDDGFAAEVVSQGEMGERVVRLHCEEDPDAAIERSGHVPLPPYIKRPDSPSDRERYQTVFAREKGSVAAPTAGLHFTPEIIEACRAAGAAVAHVTLHVGLGTFRPLGQEEIESNRLHPERYAVEPAAFEAMRNARRRVAVGTTSVRTLESALRRGLRGETDLFIYPGFEFLGTDAMLTNFHLPGSSLLVLVCAFAGRELALAAYRHAVEERYRFYSYGDCMLIV
jgi:S-adenosylmethionine:tRNA ribosyltransferase-isomerase